MLKPKIVISSHQKRLFNRVLNHPDKIGMFKGEAGTGKSTTIGEFLLSLPSSSTVAMTTTTHQSLAVLKTMVPDGVVADIVYGTIHSFLGYTVREMYGKTTLVPSTKPTSLSEVNVDFLFIDEASMITKQLHEVMNYDGFHRAQKIIYIGDEIQLTIDDFMNFDSIYSEELTENYRQDTNSDLYKYCQILRKAIKDKSSPPALPFSSPDIVQISDHEEFIYSYRNSISNNKMILAFQNKTVGSYNNAIKKYMHKKDKYSVGDTLVLIESVIDQSTNKPKIHNRERVTISDKPVPFQIDYGNDIKVSGYDIPVTLSSGRTHTLSVPDSPSKVKQILDKMAYSKDWSGFYKVKNKYTKVHHSFAGTVHSAQGSTYDEVYIDLSDFDVPNDPMRLKMMKMVYVALTRARNKAYVFIGNGRDYRKFGKEYV